MNPYLSAIRLKPDGQRTAGTIIELAKKHGWKANNDQIEPWREPLNVLEEFTAPPYESCDLPVVMAKFVSAFSRASGFDMSILSVSTVISAAAMIDDRYRLLVDENTGWYESATLWGVTIAPPGAGKTPAQSAALRPVINRHTDLYQDWKTEIETLREEDLKPPQPRLFVNDVTIEKLADVLNDNPRGVLIHNDELESMLGSFDAYRGGGVSRDRGEYLKLFQGGPNQIERVKRGTVFIRNWGASILSATTPSALAKLSSKLPNDGLLQRFLIGIGKRPESGSREVSTQVESDAYANTLLRMFRKRAELPIVIQMTPEATGAFREWQSDANARVEAAESMSDGYASHVSKHAQMLARVALVFHFVDTAELDSVPPLSGKAMDQAIRFMRKADLHAMVLYTTLMNSAGPMLLAREVAKAILGTGSNTILRRELTSAVRSFRDADDHARDRAMRLLEDYGWIRPTNGAYKKGHVTHWEVNPSIARLYWEQAARERTRRAVVMEKIAAAAEARRTEKLNVVAGST